MSNLYKQRYVNSVPENMRVINSNQMVEQKLEQLRRTFLAQNDQDESEDGFTAGITVQELDMEQLVEPETDYVQEAKEEAERILTEARAQAEMIVSEADQRADAICEQARESGRQQGYADGSEAAALELQREQQEYEDRKNFLEEQYNKQLTQMEPQLLDVILQVVERVFRIQFTDKREILLYLITKTLTGMESCTRFLIHAGHSNYSFLETHKDEILRAAGEESSVNIITDAVIGEEHCLIETDFGVYDCTIDTELKNLIKDIRSLCS